MTNSPLRFTGIGWCARCHAIRAYRTKPGHRPRCDYQYTKHGNVSPTLCWDSPKALTGEHADAIEAAFRLGGYGAAKELWIELGEPTMG